MQISRAIILALAPTALAVAFGSFQMPAGPPAALAARSCDPARPHDDGDFDEVLVSGGFGREYILHIPPSYDGDSAVPLVLNFHGLGSHAQEQNDYSGLPDKSDEEGFILVAPEGTVTSFIPSKHWNFTTLEAFEDTPDDVAFVDELLDALEAELCIDTARVYSAGMSNGAQMSVRLACNLSERIAAAAPVAGLYYPPFSPALSGEPACASTREVPLVAFHGARDTIIKFDGGALGLPIPFDTFSDRGQGAQRLGGAPRLRPGARARDNHRQRSPGALRGLRC